MASGTDFSALEIEGLDTKLDLLNTEQVNLCNVVKAFPCASCSGNESTHNVILCVENKSICVCGHVLSIASPVFKAMIQGDFKEGKEKTITLPGKTFSGIVHLLQCIYPNNLRKVTGIVTNFLS